MNTEEDTLDFIEESLGTIQGLEEKNKELTAKLAGLIRSTSSYWSKPFE